MTDQELKDLVGNLTIDVNKLADAQQKAFESIERVSGEIDRVNKEVNTKIDKLHITLGGVGKNNGDVAEEFFFNGLNEKMEIGKIKFETIDRNVTRITKRLQDEFDIVMTNTESIIILEVKYKFHPKDVEIVLKKISNYKKLFPSYKNYFFYGGIAGLSMPNDTVKNAMEYGFFVLTQSGNNLKVLNDNVFTLGTTLHSG
ncbi:hypothetical protein MHK_000369 [Candidatus Magnetomorum sp. HK-1]|nr:hypothetical protein MHK_000369 [Candidatus Magnetomorum sp. HK-1]